MLEIFNLGTKTRGFISAILVLLIVAASAVVIRFSPEIMVDAMLAKDIKAEAKLWELRVLNRLSEGGDVFLTKYISKNDSTYLQNITEDSDVYRFNLFTPDGINFWSSKKSTVGESSQVPLFTKVITSGKQYYTHEAVLPSDVDDLELHVLGPSSDGLRESARVLTPVMSDGTLLGAIEFFTDITDLRNTYINRARISLIAILATFTFLVAVIVFIIHRSNSVSEKRFRKQTIKEHGLMEQQLQMAREVRLLGELNEWLQSSRSLEELFEMVSKFMTHILPECEGTVYVYSNSRDTLDGCASWNGGSHKEHISPSSCWGLRRGRTFSYGESEVDFICEHMDATDQRAYFCFPILAHGETVGLLTLKAKSNETQEIFAQNKRLAQMCAEQISMAIANVRMRDQLHEQSVRDPLTGLFNRRHMTDSLRKMITRSLKDGSALSLISIDVDHFKKFNDNHGHDAGDMVLRAVGSAMVQLCNRDEVACRPGGEEFMMLLPDLSKEEAFDRAEKLRKKIEEITVRYGEKNLPRITISIGISYFPDHGTMPQDLLRAADEALYEAKAKGRNQTVVANSDTAQEDPEVQNSEDTKVVSEKNEKAVPKSVALNTINSEKKAS